MARRAAWPPRIFNHPCGQERVTIRGKAYYLGPIGSVSAKEKYLELVKRCEEAGLDKPPPKLAKKSRSHALTVAEVVELHAKDARVRYDPVGKEAAQFDYACAPLLKVCPALPANRFGTTHLEAVRDEMIRRGWNRRVINRRIIRVRTLFRWAELKGHVPPGVWAGLRALPPLPKNDRRVKKSPEDRKPPEWVDFAKACRFMSPTVRDMLLVQLFAGTRPEETRTMLVGELERPAEGGDWIYRPEQHKNAWREHGRAVVIGPRARKVLAKYLEGKKKKPTDYVFISGYDKGGLARCYTDCSYPRAVARACERTGVPPFSPYDLRHLAKRRATRAGGLEEARALLGHRSVTTTAHEYDAGVDLDLAAKAARKVG